MWKVLQEVLLKAKSLYSSSKVGSEGSVPQCGILRSRKRPGVLSCAVREAGIPPAVRARILTETSIESAPRTRSDD